MRLLELAEELGRDPLEVMVLLLHSPKAFFVGSTQAGPGVDVSDWAPPTYDIYSIKIDPNLVQEAREFIMNTTAKEVIKHVKEHGTASIRRQEKEDPFLDDSSDPFLDDD